MSIIAKTRKKIKDFRTFEHRILVLPKGLNAAIVSSRSPLCHIDSTGMSNTNAGVFPAKWSLLTSILAAEDGLV